MTHHADVLNPEGVKRPRIRRPRVLQVVIGPGNHRRPSGRRNPHGWRYANEARRRQGQEKTAAMARRWEQAGQVFPGNRGVVVATLFGVSRAAAYQRMYRARRGFYEGELRPRPRKTPAPDLTLELVWEPAPERKPER
jgi:hypothetical protein